jgi:putative transposase
MAYDPKIHHRRSIRLKGHDYAGGGLYFITICAHREFISAMGGAPFPGVMREIIEQHIRITAEKCPQVEWGEWVVMPDHFHALIRMRKGTLRLGDVLGGFKSAVSKEWRRIGAEGARNASPVREKAEPRIWHRNYYEVMVRSPEAEEKISEYIRMNPWRCVQQFENGLRGMGNVSLWHLEKTGVLCSRGEGRGEKRGEACRARTMDGAVYLSGFHSPMEKEILAALLKAEVPVICCPAWGLDTIPAVCAEPLQQNRMLIVEMRNQEGNLTAAEKRNRFVLEQSDRLWIPFVNPGGMLERLMREVGVKGKLL